MCNTTAGGTLEKAFEVVKLVATGSYHNNLYHDVKNKNINLALLHKQKILSVQS